MKLLLAYCFTPILLIGGLVAWLHNKYLRELMKYLILATLIIGPLFYISIPLKIANTTYPVPALILVLLIYILFFAVISYEAKIILNKNSIIGIYLVFINLLIALQLFLLTIYNFDTFCLIFNTYLGALLIYVFFTNFEKINYSHEIIIKLSTIFCAVNFILAIQQYLTGKFVLFLEAEKELRMIGNSFYRVSGFITGDNGAGTLGIIFFPLVLYNFINNKNALNLIILLGDIWFILFTFTRIAYIALIIQIIIFFLYQIKSINLNNIFKTSTLIVVLLTIIFYVYPLISPTAQLVLYDYHGDSQNERFKQYPAAIHTFKTSPWLGVGSGQYNYAAARIGINDYLNIHSQWLNVLVENGVIVFCLFVFLNFSLLAQLLNKYKDPSERWMIVAIFTGYLISTNFNPNQYYVANNYLYFFVLIGLLFSKRVADG